MVATLPRFSTARWTLVQKTKAGRLADPRPIARIGGKVLPTLSLTPAAAAWLRGATHARMMVDTDRAVVGIEPASKNQDHSFSIQRSKSGAATITCAPLVRLIGEGYTGHRFLVDLDEDITLVFALNQPLND